MSKKIAVTGSMMAALFAFVVWASPAQAQVHNDHYACYGIKNKLVGAVAGSISNQVQPLAMWGKCKAKLLCVPSFKNGGGVVTNPNAHYVCYKCKSDAPEINYTVTDQFGSGPVTTKKFSLLCNQASKL